MKLVTMMLLVLLAMRMQCVPGGKVHNKEGRKKASSSSSRFKKARPHKKNFYTEADCRNDFKAMIRSVEQKFALPRDIHTIFRDKIFRRDRLARCKQDVHDLNFALFHLRDSMKNVWDTLEAYEREYDVKKFHHHAVGYFNCGAKIERDSENHKFSYQGGSGSPIPVKAAWLYQNFRQLKRRQLRDLCCAAISTRAKKCAESLSMGEGGFTFKRIQYAEGRLLCHAKFVE